MPAETGPYRQSGAMKNAPTQTARILVVDDDPAIRSMLEAVFTDEGYDVGTAGDGSQALDSVQAERPDVIVLDLMMPVMDGVTFYRELRSRIGDAAAPAVIVVTARRITDETRRSLPGAASIIAKPFDLDELLERVEEQLRRPGGA